MAEARIPLLGDDVAKWTSGSWWGLGTCCVCDAAVQPGLPHPGGSGRLDWLLQSESGPVGETWVKKISFHQFPETLHLFSAADIVFCFSQTIGCEKAYHFQAFLRTHISFPCCVPNNFQGQLTGEIFCEKTTGWTILNQSLQNRASSGGRSQKPQIINCRPFDY